MIDYYEYLRSKEWRAVANEVKRRASYRCQVCNSPDQLVAHHRTYEHLGDEMNHLGDVICLCDSCHRSFHKPIQTPTGMKPTVYPDRPKPKPSPKAPKPEERPVKVYITRKDTGKLTTKQPAYDWFIANDYDPTRSGWVRKVVGHWVPSFCIQEAFRKKMVKSNGETIFLKIR